VVAIQYIHTYKYKEKQQTRKKQFLLLLAVTPTSYQNTDRVDDRDEMMTQSANKDAHTQHHLATNRSVIQWNAVLQGVTPVTRRYV